MTPTNFPIQSAMEHHWPHVEWDWKINITTVTTIGMLLVGWGFDKAMTSSRIATVETQSAALNLAIDRLSLTVGRLDGTLTILRTQVEERQHQADMRMDRGDSRLDRAELHAEGRR